eukprot:scaffold7328_cov314-Pinguiococcus_pyrenoidosus.AAC.29
MASTCLPQRPPHWAFSRESMRSREASAGKEPQKWYLMIENGAGCSPSASSQKSPCAMCVR